MQLDAGSMLGHYRIVRLLGEGGMGAVYVAEDTRLGRKVALKILPSGIADDPDSLARFRREARSAAALNHPGIVTLHSVEEVDGVHFITMELLEGTTLKGLIPAEGLAFDRAADLALRLTEAVAAAHSQGLVHRDLKPSNAMIVGEDRLKVIDFGLARGSKGASATDTAVSTDFLTEEGIVSGTLAYMAPEQLLGRRVDCSTDVWALGAVAYEMMAGRRPFQAETSPGLVDAILNADPPSLASLRPDLPADFVKVVERALAKEPSQRYASAVEMAEALRDVVDGVGGARERGDRPARTRWAAAAIAILVVISAVAVWNWLQTTRRERVRREAIPDIVRMIETDDYASAFTLAREAESALPGDPVLAELWPRMSRRIELRSQPNGAAVSSRPYAGSEEDWQVLGITPVEVRLPIGFHRFRFELDGHLTVEKAIRLAPLSATRQESDPDDAVDLEPQLPRVGTIPAEMVEIPAGQMWVEVTGLEFLEPLDTEPYLMDRFEVSNQEYAEFVATGGYEDPQYWTEAMARSHDPRPWRDLVSDFVDATGRPGPSTWEVGSYPEGLGGLPVSGISWFEASAYCAFRGKILPTLHHWSHAAQPYYFAAEAIPFSNFGGDGATEVGSNLGMTEYGVYDMAGNVKEWCENGTGSNQRYILGGAWPEASYMFLDPDARNPLDRSATNGVRCMRVPAGLPADHRSRQDVQYHTRDYADEEPVSDELFSVYAGLYAGDDAPLRATVETVDESSRYWRREVVTFDTGYDEGRMILHLMVPRQGTPPYRTVVYFPGSGAILRTDSSQINPSPFDYLVRQGWAVAYPILEGTYERRTSHETDFPNESNSFREWNLHLAQDLRRTIDYLETRQDIDTSSLGYLGFSWGGERGAIMLSIEDRFRVAVFLSGGLTTGRSVPEADPFNFAPRVRVPVLMLNGFHDYFFPVESGQKPLFEALGTPAEHKRHVVYEDDGHSLHSGRRRNQVISEILAWFEKYQPQPATDGSQGVLH
ncbi:MAG: protein kinase [Acidobacteriota bacterium]|jgi:formylglycine-generating enzyme required for sulfatase activity/dienelactone hydrolase